jgi:hypothetical protein
MHCSWEPGSRMASGATLIVHLSSIKGKPGVGTAFDPKCFFN